MAPLPGPIRQAAYVVDDLEAAMARWVTLGVGPWFVMPRTRQQGYFLGDDPVSPDLTMAFANSGALQIELIHQHDDGPSAFRSFAPTDPGGYHHLAWWTDDFAAATKTLDDLGTRVSHGDGGGAALWAYYRLDGATSPLVEIMELNDATRWMVGTVADAHTGWDGTDPVRSLW